MGVFDGIKILQFAWAVAGPLSVQPMADQGATVVKVESSKRPDFARTLAPFKDDKPGIDRSASYAIKGHNRYSLALDFQHQRSREVIDRLLPWADILLENFSPGTMEELGLSYEDVKKVNPSIIYLHASIQGQTGPHSKQPGFGVLATALTGVTAITGWPDRDAVVPFDGYADFILPRFAAATTIAALAYRNRTGKGQELDISQLEAVMHFIAPLLLDYSVNKREMGRMGNACPNAVPHGVYPCRGQDRWVAIAVFTDDEWTSFCEAMGCPEWEAEPRFATFLGRKEHEDELNSLVSSQTISYTAEEMMTRLQAYGVAAGLVENNRDMIYDPQLKHRGALQTKEHPILGEMLHWSEFYKLSETEGEVSLTSPLVGQHTEFICKKLLGMPDSVFSDLEKSGVFC